MRRPMLDALRRDLATAIRYVAELVDGRKYLAADLIDGTMGSYRAALHENIVLRQAISQVQEQLFVARREGAATRDKVN